MDEPRIAAGAEWVECVDWAAIRSAIGARSVEIAVASTLGYAEPPRLTEGALVAVLRDPEDEQGRDDVRVRLWMAEARASLEGSCSHCHSPFGPCAHVAIAAIDLATTPALRAALVCREGAGAAAVAAVRARRALHLERAFAGALAAWTSARPTPLAIELAASPLDEDDAFVVRDYGDRSRGPRARCVTVVGRRVGERKLLSSHDLCRVDALSVADRSVLRYVRDRGGGRKAVYASGVHASILLEAMRKHGGVHAQGFQGLLDFRTTFVRPVIKLSTGDAVDPSSLTPPSGSSPFPLLRAFWVPEQSLLHVPFEEAVFFAGPFPYVWTTTGAIYRVCPDVEVELVERLAASPVLAVPPHKLREAGLALLGAGKGAGVVLPASESFGLPPREAPRFVVRLSGEPLHVEAELTAAYTKGEFSLASPPVPSNEAARLGRDIEAEERARAFVLSSGLVIEDDDGRVFFRADEDEAVAFWQTGVTRLRGSGDPSFEVILSSRLAKVRVGPPLVATVTLSLEGNWLKTRLEFTSRELAVEMEDVRAALARKERWVCLSDGTLARISSAVQTLVDEAGAVMGGESDAVLPPHQLGRLERWVEENDGRVDAAVQALRGRLRALAVAPDPVVPKALRATLRPYQRAGLAWLQFLHALGAGGILADDMGLGKTLMTLAFLLGRREADGRAPSLVVCPTSVAPNWVNEAARFTPGLRVVLLHGTSKAIRAGALREAARTADVIVTTYTLVRSDLEALAAIRFRCVVLDEAQNIKNSETATKRAASKLVAETRLALTGTPIENRLRELWSIASFVNPGMLGSQRTFETRYERPIATDPKSPLGEELRAIVRPFLLRRTKDAVLSDLPPKTEVERWIALEPADKRMYDALAHTLRESLARDFERKNPREVSVVVFTALMRLRQMACDPRLFDKELPASRSAKREAFLEIARELASEGRRALVFSQFVELLSLWRADLDREKIAYEYLDGSTRRREEVIARFQGGSAPLFLISLKAGGAGLNLTAADTVILCDPWWNPAVEDQATDRAHRIGQDKPVTVVRLIAKGTIEEKMLSLKAKKRAIALAMLGGGPAALSGITREDLAILLGDAEEGPPEPKAAAHPAERSEPTDRLASATRVLDPDFHAVVAQAQRWLVLTGRPHGELASLTEIPPDFAERLARGQPFPCSRAVGDRIRRRIAAW